MARGRSDAKFELQPGAILDGKYRIEGLIGRGGMAIVLMARHIELGQRVAIKVLPQDHIKDRELVKRFMREAQAAVRLRTEHAVKVSDVGKQKNGAPYMVMELLEGEDLARIVARRPFAVPVAVDCIIQVGEAIAEAHAMGMVHRDLKLKNLFLTSRQPDRPFVKVLDFGLVKDVSLLEDAKGALTATSAVLGSPHYMSPEQMRASRDVDGATDIWALGVCLYELLAGRPPFPGDTVAVVCAAVLKQDPIPLLAVAPHVPPALWNVVNRCLQKDPNARFTTVLDLVRALEPFAPPHAMGASARIGKMMRALPTMVISAARDEDDEDEAKPLLSERGAFIAAALTVFAIVSVAGVVIVTQVREKPTTRAPAVGVHHYEPDPRVGFASPSLTKAAVGPGDDGENDASAPSTPSPVRSFPPTNAPSTQSGGDGVGEKNHQLKLGPAERL